MSTGFQRSRLNDVDQRQATNFGLNTTTDVLSTWTDVDVLANKGEWGEIRLVHGLMFWD